MGLQFSIEAGLNLRNDHVGSMYIHSSTHICCPSTTGRRTPLVAEGSLCGPPTFPTRAGDGSDFLRALVATVSEWSICSLMFERISPRQLWKKVSQLLGWPWSEKNKEMLFSIYLTIRSVSKLF